MILLKKTQALAWMGQLYLKQKGELDNWDELVKETIKPPSFISEINQRCPRGNHLTYTNVVKFQASTRDPWDELFASFNGILRTSPYVPHGPSHKPKMARPPRRTFGRSKEEQRQLKKLVTVLVTSALKKLTWTVPRKLLLNEFHLSSTLLPSEKNLTGSEVNTIHPTFAKKLGL